MIKCGKASPIVHHASLIYFSCSVTGGMWEKYCMRAVICCSDPLNQNWKHTVKTSQASECITPGSCCWCCATPMYELTCCAQCLLSPLIIWLIIHCIREEVGSCLSLFYLPCGLSLRLHISLSVEDEGIMCRKRLLINSSYDSSSSSYMIHHD